MPKLVHTYSVTESVAWQLEKYLIRHNIGSNNLVGFLGTGKGSCTAVWHLKGLAVYCEPCGADYSAAAWGAMMACTQCVYTPDNTAPAPLHCLVCTFASVRVTLLGTQMECRWLALVVPHTG